MLILGVESSCDETAIAVVDGGRRVLSSCIASQVAAHQPFGGVVPEVAAREHLKTISPLMDQALESANISLDDINAVAVTQGPGLIGALLVGVAFAKGVALGRSLPLIPVDHVHAHVLGAILGIDVPDGEIYPTLALVVSGGHTNLYRLTSPTTFQLLGTTVDDACGECFDKVAKLLGLGYPGGPAVEHLAQTGDPRQVPMPQMVSQRSRLEFSYSGLKTYIANRIRQLAPGGNPADLCAAFQEEALGQLVRKLSEALRRFADTRSVLVAGGVAANSRLRAMMSERLPVRAFFPPLKYCSDNAAMIAAYGYHIWQEGQRHGRNFHNHDWDAYSRYDFLATTKVVP